MGDTVSKLRQQLGTDYRVLGRLLRVLLRDRPLVPGTLYLLRRKCGKANCRCARGEGHASWVLTRSEAGQSRLYPVPKEQRGRVRSLTREYRLWQLARARWIKHSAAMVALMDRMCEERQAVWPPPKPDGPGPG
jgi:hypothetical protein